MNTAQKIFIYDTTLRDGLQSHGITCSLEDKIKIVKKLAKLGVPFIEGGWPGANSVDTQLFAHLQQESLGLSQLVAFGSTRRPHQRASEDHQIKGLIAAQTRWITIFGKSWDLHVREALRVSLDENLAMIRDTVEFLQANQRRVIYDAEHWFDGYKENPEYALKTIEAALSAGAEWIVLCDTNGGTLPKEIEAIVAEVHWWLQQFQPRDQVSGAKEQLPRLGIHTHNDSDTAVANAMAAVDAGATMVQGTINGYGERCGNADLCSLVPNLQLKMGFEYITPLQLDALTETSRFVSETLNLAPNNNAAYVGRSAFAHKGGIHISAVARNPKTYEHILPKAVGNNRRIVISSASGTSTVLAKAKQYNLELAKNNPAVSNIVRKVKDLESQGYQFEAAEASFEMLMLKELGKYEPMFELKGFRVNYDVLQGEVPRYTSAQATIKVSVNGDDVLEVAECMGPVSALDKALRKALIRVYPIVGTFHLTDYKVRILNSDAGTAANIRVLVESSNGDQRWSTIGVSVNILEASYQAIVAGIEYGLHHYRPQQVSR